MDGSIYDSAIGVLIQSDAMFKKRTTTRTIALVFFFCLNTRQLAFEWKLLKPMFIHLNLFFLSQKFAFEFFMHEFNAISLQNSILYQQLKMCFMVIWLFFVFWTRISTSNKRNSPDPSCIRSSTVIILFYNVFFFGLIYCNSNKRKKMENKFSISNLVGRVSKINVNFFKRKFPLQ